MLSRESERLNSLEGRLLLYERALALVKQGYTLADIGRTLEVGNYRVRYWLKHGPPKRIGRYEPDLSPSPDLAYVAGFYLGDGRSAGHEPKVRFKLADREQLEYVSKLVAQILRRAPKRYAMEGPFYVVDYDSVVLSNYLNKPAKWLVSHLKGFKRDFLQGFFDAEGYVSCGIDHRARRVGPLVVGVANTRLSYLHIMRSLLGSLEVEGAIRKTNKKGGTMTIRGESWIRRHDVYHLVIQRPAAVRRYYQHVGFRNRAKSEKLKDLFDLQNKPLIERYAHFMAHYRKKGHK